MPELPEVETIRRELAPIIGRKVTGVSILRRDIIYPRSPHRWQSLSRRKITGIRRRGKYLIIELGRGFKVIFHLRLSGRLILAPAQSLPHDRLIIHFAKTNLHFIEPRVLGRAYLLAPDDRPKELAGFFQLGPEPLDREFTIDYLTRILASRRAKVKSLLLDQSLIAGLGNIYADEALFDAKISPLRPAGSLNPTEIRRLHHSIRKILGLGIRFLGTSVSDYQRPDGRRGSFQRYLKVYRREGLPCLSCGTKIKRVKVGNRSWRFCPNCQR